MGQGDWSGLGFTGANHVPDVITDPPYVSSHCVCLTLKVKLIGFYQNESRTLLKRMVLSNLNIFLNKLWLLNINSLDIF